MEIASGKESIPSSRNKMKTNRKKKGKMKRLSSGVRRREYEEINVISQTQFVKSV